MDIDVDYLKKWVGTTRESHDVISPRLANSLAAILDEEPDLVDGDPPPAGIHWCLSPEIAPMSKLGPDGHPARGGHFLPPVPLPRRMWAGGELTFSEELRVGDPVTRTSRIVEVELKTGRTGNLCFVRVNHEYTGPRGRALTERQDIVYRSLAPSVNAPSHETHRFPFTESHQVEASPTLLARYSQVTFNGHRIHYDRDYCQRQEAYPGLLVHGPLQATFLLRLAYRMSRARKLRCFAFRGLSPLFDGGHFSVNAVAIDPSCELWISSKTDCMTMKAKADYA